VRTIIESIVFFVLLILLALRPLVPETFSLARHGMMTAIGEVGDPSPITTILLNVTILLAATVVFFLRRREGMRHTGLGLGTVLLVLAVVLSSIFADDRRVAINAGLDFLALPILAIALVQLLSSPFRKRLLLAVVMASALAQAVQCFEEYFIEHGETWAFYLENKDSIWERQGVELDDPRVTLFENRMKAREAQGFLPHSNITGSYLVLTGFAGLGLVIAGWRKRNGGSALAAALPPLFGTLLILGAIWLTGSLGASISLGIGVVFWMVVHFARGWIHRHRPRALAIGWGIVALGMLAVIGHGLYHGSLPGASLNFRWQYWTTSAPLIADHGLLGVGRENFGHHYLQYKPITAPEEISNPHNLFVQSMAELGVLGLVAVIALLIGGSRAIARRRGAENETSTSATGDGPPVTTFRMFGWGALLLILLLSARIPLLGTMNPSYVYFKTAMLTVTWGIGFVLFSPVAISRHRAATTGVAVGLFAFLVHEMINFALFVPGTATTFAALYAFAVAGDTRDARGLGKQARPMILQPWLWAAILTAGAILLALIPVARTASHLFRAEQRAAAFAQGRLSMDAVNEAFASATQSDPWDPYPVIAWMRWSTSIAQARPDVQAEAFAAGDKARQFGAARFGNLISFARALTQFMRVRAEATRDGIWYRFADVAVAGVVRLYPSDPDGHIFAGDLALAHAQAIHDEKIKGADPGQRVIAHLAKRAVAHYEKALALDAARPDWEIIRRLPQRQVAEIENRMAEAKALIRPKGD